MTEVLRMAAFTTDPAGGNPAGVVLDASAIDAVAMQRIAAEVGYAETAFVVRPPTPADPDAVGIRYFSPTAEVPFCGHATVATAVVLADRARAAVANDGRPAGSASGPVAATFRFATAVGEVRITTTTSADGPTTAAFTSVLPRVEAIDADVLGRLLAVLRVPAGVGRASRPSGDAEAEVTRASRPVVRNRPMARSRPMAISDLRADHPPRLASAGNTHPVLSVADRAVFDAFTFDPVTMRALMDEQGWAGTVTVVHALDAVTFLARNPFPVGVIDEDPATGSAAAALGGYLRALDLVVPPARVVVHQGEHVGRPGVLVVDVPVRGGIVVRGSAVVIPG